MWLNPVSSFLGEDQNFLKHFTNYKFANLWLNNDRLPASPNNPTLNDPGPGRA